MLGDLWKESSLAEALADRWREEGMGQMLQVVLESRFGPLSDDIVAALRTTDEATLRAIGEHVMTDTLEQVRAPGSGRTSVVIADSDRPPGMMKSATRKQRR